MRALHLLLCLVPLMPHLALCYPDYVPQSACDWLAPWHEPYTDPAEGPAPYKLRIYHSQAPAGIPVPVSVVGSQPFLGFMVQAHDAGSGQAVGSWQVTPHIPATTMTCSNPDNTVTHNSRVSKQLVPLAWLPPKGYNGTVFFKGTVVATYTTYWTDIASAPFRVVSV
ncbi:hypothetical protein O3P69_009226 [Scylla paramamosain]|uniref:Reelin domain-containing protein n=2 Tax=Scylla paramamosain TaxID=85552 RepID=A0AAW0TC15_SCYPA